MRRPRLIPVLLVLLAAQLLLAYGLWVLPEEAPPPRARLLSFDRDGVDRIEIDDGKQTLLLTKTDGHWVLPGLFDFPAAAFRVDGLLDDLAGLRPGLAVATTDAAAARFRVAADGYGRRVRLLSGDTELAVLYLGDAAGPRRAYGRAAGDAAVYALSFTAFQADAAVDGWSDKTLLHRSVADIRALRLGRLTLQRDGDDWRLADQAADEVVDQGAAAALVARVAGLNFMAVQGRADQPPQGPLLLDAELTLTGDKRVRYRFIDPGRDGDPLLWVSDRDHVLRIGSHVFAPIRATAREQLLKTPQPVVDAPPE